MKNVILLGLGMFVLVSALQAQVIGGRVTDLHNNPIVGATVVLVERGTGTETDVEGNFGMDNVGEGEVTLTVSMLGYVTYKTRLVLDANVETLPLMVQLQEDNLNLDEVIVTGTFNEGSKLRSSVAITTLDAKAVEARSMQGTGALLQAVPGTFVDMSAGEVGARVFPRGLVSGFTQSPGFQYVSLQEDGLPVMSTQYVFSWIDLFHRPDVTVQRLEAIRGGSASISSSNSPGGIYNFISREGGDVTGGILKVTGGIQGDNRPMGRVDATVGGMIGDSPWHFQTGGFYRYDKGARNVPFVANVGGQWKLNVTRRFAKGGLKVFAKVLDDQVTFYNHLPVADMSTGEAFEGFNLNTNSFYQNIATDELPNNELLRTDSTAKRSFHSDKGIRTKNYALGIQGNVTLGDGWLLKNQFKYSRIAEKYQQFRGNVLLETDGAVRQYFPIPAFLFNAFQYYDAATGELLYDEKKNINHIGEYIMASATLTVDNHLHDIMDQLSISKQLGNHQLTAGGFGSYADIRFVLTGDVIVNTFEPSPRLLRIVHDDPFSSDTTSLMHFTDDNGFLVQGGAQYNHFEGAATSLAAFANDVWQLNDRLSLDAGIRFEAIHHTGRKEQYETPTQMIGFLPAGVDGDYHTFYDAGTRIGNGEYAYMDFWYPYLSASLGANYTFNDHTALYLRATKGNKAPEMSYYINNFSNQPITKSDIEQIYQSELGLKYRQKWLALFLTGFFSQMNNVPYQDFIVGNGGVSVNTPVTFNKIRTLGTELEAIISPLKNLKINLIATVQNPRFVNFTYYNVNGTPDDVFIGSTYPSNNPWGYDEGTPSDDYLEYFDGNQVSQVPSFIFDITPSYTFKFLSINFNWRYTGTRPANRRNSLTMPAFSVFNAGIQAFLSKTLIINLQANNINNSAGLMEFNGIGKVGASVEDVTTAIAQETLSAGKPFFARPILPRSLSAGILYQF